MTTEKAAANRLLAASDIFKILLVQCFVCPFGLFPGDTKHPAGGVPNLKNGGILRFPEDALTLKMRSILKTWENFPKVGIAFI